MRWLRPLTWTPVLLSLGCYRYVPADTGSLRAGTEVRTRLSAAEAERIGELLQTNGRLLEGRLVEAEGDQLLLQVPVAYTQVGSRPGALHQRVGIPRSEIVEVELKQLDRKKTGALIAASAIVAGAVLYSQLSAEGGGYGTEEPGGGGVNEVVVPGVRLFSIPLGRWR